MRTRLVSSVRNPILKFVLSSAFVLSFATGLVAGPEKTVRVSATGQIFPPGLCADPDLSGDLCQDVQVTGIATVLGRVSGELSEHVNPSTGEYAGTGVFTTADGSTITTEFEGQVIFFPNGTASFSEIHTIVDGTGQYENSSGTLNLTGTGDAFGHLDVSGTGTFIKG
jgi:hypothetical protein